LKCSTIAPISTKRTITPQIVDPLKDREMLNTGHGTGIKLS